MLKRNLLIAGYIITLVGFFLYSFTQIDLSLALSRLPAIQKIVVAFQYIGYFNRPQSTLIYIILLSLLFIFYILLMQFAQKIKLSQKNVWVLIGIAAVLFTFAYNAFSYDLFNYIFDARIITHYHANPYLHKALDYPGDPMLSFMRWTHRVYPYGPTWLAFTVPLSYLGMNYFIVNFLLFKLLMTASFLLSVFFIAKIFRVINHEKEIAGMIFFGLNPLVLIEGVMDAHIDIVMMALALGAFYFLLQNKNIAAYVLLFLSIGTKFVTGLIAPIFVFYMLWQKQKIAINWTMLFILFILPIVIGIILESIRSTFQPWYLIPAIAFSVFLLHKYYITIPTIIISFFAMLTYVPFLFTGNWNPPIPTILSDIYFFSYALSFLVVALTFSYKQYVLLKAHQKTVKQKNDKK